jgi:hypothetical protein
MLRRNALVILILSAVVAHLPCSYAQESKSGSLTTQDYIDIQQLYARYNYAIDAGDVEAYVALFVPEGSFNKFVGHDGLRTFMKNRTAGNRRHWNTNLVITPTPEGAKGAVYLMFVDVGLKSPAITGAGKYEDTLIKTSEGWRFSKRMSLPEGPALAPTPGATPRP